MYKIMTILYCSALFISCVADSEQITIERKQSKLTLFELPYINFKNTSDTLVHLKKIFLMRKSDINIPPIKNGMSKDLRTYLELEDDIYPGFYGVINSFNRNIFVKGTWDQTELELCNRKTNQIVTVQLCDIKPMSNNSLYFEVLYSNDIIAVEFYKANTDLLGVCIFDNYLNDIHTQGYLTIEH